jgi:arsenite methyltransferase
MSTTQVQNDEAIREQVRESYGRIAQTGGSCCGPSCCAPADQLAERIGYAADDLEGVPEGANLGLSCGNPTALASLRPGEIVIDLGSGGGLDVFIAGEKVGERGRAIGVDMTPEMIARARRNLASYETRTGLRNVEFRLGEIEHLPVADASADAVISNCVINLSPNKRQVWRDVFRALKPGGRVAVSDLALLRPLPEEVARMVEALVGCIAGAALVGETESMLREAGFTEIRLELKPDYLCAMEEWKDPLYAKIIEHLPAGLKPEDYITSLSISARKPE